MEKNEKENHPRVSSIKVYLHKMADNGTFMSKSVSYIVYASQYDRFRRQLLNHERHNNAASLKVPRGQNRSNKINPFER